MRTVPNRHADPNRDRWMISYMDVLTILLIFFVAATAQTMLPHPPPAVLAAPPKPELVVTHAPEERPVNKLDQLEKMGLDMTREPRGLVIRLPQAVLFGSGKDEINPKAKAMVEQIAAVLREVPNKVTLVGHADAVPIHNKRFRNNWELASARGLRLLELLQSEGGIEESRLSVASYSSVNPKDSNETPDGRASNRRVEIVIQDER